MVPLQALFRARLGEKLHGQLLDALATGGHTHTVQDIIDACLSGDSQMHQGERSLAITEIIDHPRARVLHVWMAAGDMEELFDALYPRVEAFARFHGCDRITMVGRIGWQRAAKRIGFQDTHVAMTRMIASADDREEIAA